MSLTEANYCTQNGDYVPDYPIKLKPFPQPEDVDPPVPVAVDAPAPRRAPVAYVSGPIRDARGPWYVELNIRRAEAIAVELWKLGFAVVCPHTNTRHMDGVISPEQFIQGDLELVRRADVCVMVAGWSNSVGATEERAAALASDVLVLYWDRVADRAALELVGRDGRDWVAQIKKARTQAN